MDAALFRPLLVEKWLKNSADCDKSELEVVAEIIEQLRTRLHDVGWFMCGVNEVIARMANAEDKIKWRLYKRLFCLLPSGSAVPLKNIPDIFVGGAL